MRAYFDLVHFCDDVVVGQVTFSVSSGEENFSHFFETSVGSGYIV